MKLLIELLYKKNKPTCYDIIREQGDVPVLVSNKVYFNIEDQIDVVFNLIWDATLN